MEELNLKQSQSKRLAEQTEKHKISDETMEYVGILAKLELSAQEQKEASEDMERMLAYIDKLNELDTSGAEPMSHIFSVNNVFREDIVKEQDGGEDTLANAPEQRNRAFVVPKTVDQ
ncbi:MAG: Asp-tRNA(Asn)/Glu-tRNA(Gln) amidotransferase subunit GatC [Lachnospiraceae bacterium]|nr:Asp-tRNA(Asn)/Glu-tRNA(Gln) amidotransferase subunit GatC [Lachnospiraceae bacterium]